MPDEAKIREEDQNLAGINVEEVACSICGQYESTDDNDIIMCDRTNCFRAFHVKCCEPVMTSKCWVVRRRTGSAINAPP